MNIQNLIWYDSICIALKFGKFKQYFLAVTDYNLLEYLIGAVMKLAHSKQ